MLFTHTTFLGIDPTAGKRPFSFAALDNELSLLALSRGNIDEVLAFCAGQRHAFAAICAPRRPNQGLMLQTEVREVQTPPPRPGRWTNFRLVEYQLRQRNITAPQTSSEEESCPRWMQMGFTLYRRLEVLGYRSYPDEDQSRQYIEVYPHACFTTILETIPFPKKTLEGRIQRQLSLYNQNVDVPDAMRLFEEITRHKLLQGILPFNDLYSQGELDALVAAYTAWLAANHPDEITSLGDPREGQVILPVSELKPRY
jgi:hypothetical protein